VENGTNDRDGQTVASVRTAEVVVAAIIFACAALFVYSSYKLGFRWSSDGPESGFFPFYVSLIICCSSAVVIFQALTSKSPKVDESFAERGQVKRVMSVLIPALVYVLGIQLIGIYVSSAIYITLFMHYIGKYSWVKSVALGVTINVVFFFMFEVWFQVPLYKGIWDLTGFTGY